MIDALYQKMASQANDLETWVAVLVVSALAYVTYKYTWLGVFLAIAGMTAWTFYTLLTGFDLSKEKEAVGFLVIFMLVALLVNGTLLYKAVTDS